MTTTWGSAVGGYLSGLRDRSERLRGIRVFCYHGVVERTADVVIERNFHRLDVFRSQMNLLKRFRVLSLDELARELADSNRPIRSAAVITFDDGYANNLLAAEVLASLGLPWSLYVSTGAIEPDGMMIWAIELSLLLLHGRRPEIDALGRRWPLTSVFARRAAFESIRSALKKRPSASRHQMMDAIREQFAPGESRALLDRFPTLRMLTWSQVAELSNAGVGIGSHGVEHELHHGDQPPAVRAFELTVSKRDLARRLGRPCRAFAFPNGSFTDASPRELKTAGYELGFTTREASITTGADPLLLPRLSASASVKGFARKCFWIPRIVGGAGAPQRRRSVGEHHAFAMAERGRSEGSHR